MELAEAGGDIGRDHPVRLRHRGVGVEVAPGVGAEMVAAEHDPVGRAAFLDRDPGQQVDEIGGLHAGNRLDD
ncbi:MAG: hypothetical protein R3D59_16075 [Paracoccaceae bacterium]